jgi:serine/threonine-protein kinase
MDDVRTSPGMIIDGRYLLESQLGGGAFAIVWRARELETKRPVALKLLHPRYRDEPYLMERFLQEAALLLALSHPNIARAYAFEIDRPEPYVAMELIEGRTLDEELGLRAENDRSFTREETRSIFLQLFRGLEYAHENNVVHRDLKPSNIMLEYQGAEFVVKILDFGLAKLTNRPSGDATTQGRVMGSFPYMAPEQARGESVDTRADVFSAGVMLFEVLTLRRAFERGDDGEWLRAYAEPVKMNKFNRAPELLGRMAYSARPKPSEVVPELERRVDELVVRALAPKAEARFADSKQMREAFERAMPARPSPIREATARMAALIAGVAVILGAAALYSSREEALPEAPESELVVAPATPVVVEKAAQRVVRETPAPLELEEEPAAPVVETKRRVRQPSKVDEVALVAPPKRSQLRADLERAAAADSSAEDLERLAERIAKRAQSIDDPAVRAKIERLARSSARLGDFKGVRSALDELERAEKLGDE